MPDVASRRDEAKELYTEFAVPAAGVREVADTALAFVKRFV